MQDARRKRWWRRIEAVSAIVSGIYAVITLSHGWSMRSVELLTGGIAAGLCIALILMALVRRLFPPVPREADVAHTDMSRRDHGH